MSGPVRLFIIDIEKVVSSPFCVLPRLLVPWLYSVDPKGFRPLRFLKASAVQEGGLGRDDPHTKIVMEILVS